MDYPASLHPLLIPVMSSTLPIHAVHDSGHPENVDGIRRIAGRHAPDSLADMDRIHWSTSAGFGGRHRPDYAVATVQQKERAAQRQTRRQIQQAGGGAVSADDDFKRVGR